MKVGKYLLLFCAVGCSVAGKLPSRKHYADESVRRCGEVLENYVEYVCGPLGYNGPNEVKKSSST